MQNRILSLFDVCDLEATNKSKLDHSLGWQQRHTRNDMLQDMFRARMAEIGLSLLGRGFYSTVWKCATGQLYKINSGLNGGTDGFYDWAVECIKSDNPALPKLSGLVVNGSRYCVELEPLESQSKVTDSYDLLRVASRAPDVYKAVELALVVSCKARKSSVYDREMTARNVDLYLDIQEANLMYRGSQLVVNDPVARRIDPIIENNDLMQLFAA